MIDYKSQDWASTGETYDAILDLMFDRPFSDYTAALTPQGVWVIGGMSAKSGFLGPLPRVLAARRDGKRVRRPVVLASWEPNQAADIGLIADWLERGALTPVIDESFTFPAAPQAMRRYERGHARGHVVVVSPGAVKG